MLPVSPVSSKTASSQRGASSSGREVKCSPYQSELTPTMVLWAGAVTRRALFRPVHETVAARVMSGRSRTVGCQQLGSPQDSVHDATLCAGRVAATRPIAIVHTAMTTGRSFTGGKIGTVLARRNQEPLAVSR